jgi:DNA-binding FrmR family transcriptional regulator
MSHLAADKSKVLARIRRLVGQMAAIEKAINGDASCSAILHQVAGARGAINGLMDELIAEHIREHVAHPKLSASARAEGAEDLIAAIRRYAK